MTDQILFDKLVYIDRLKRAGITDDQARAHAEAMDEALRESVVTVPIFRTEITRLENRIELLGRDLTVRMGVIAVALFAALAGIKFFGGQL
jgi:hypothetical protein